MQRVVAAANSITQAVPSRASNPARCLLSCLLSEVNWPAPLNAENYGNGQPLRDWFEKVVGLGLGTFDLIIVDEAHKNRSKDGGLSTVVENVVLAGGDSRRLALTATPIELDVGQWESTLKRIATTTGQRQPVVEATGLYAQAIRRLRLGWRTSSAVRDEYREAAAQFRNALRPYLLRRDKREQAARAWSILEEHLREGYTSQQGGFARLMYGETKPQTRRMIQLAFNRPNSFPRVLVAQSLVGREGLNLHESCRIVVLLHPEWNPGVVEQQIGRVDRVNSRWAKVLRQAIDDGKKGSDLPRIEIRPIIFKGTYDEHNWNVLRERWDDLRAQLHGEAVPARLRESEDEEGRAILYEIAAARPSFSPQEN